MIRRPGLDDPIPFAITRARIQLKSVPFALELENGVGYVPLLSVSETSFEEVRTAVDSLETLGIRDLILDLRGNLGGTLDQGIAITDYFLDPGRGVVETRGRAPNQNETFNAVREQTHPGLVVAVLVDERSASAAEIIAGALQDHDRAVIVGAPTWGKGSVQTLYPLTGGNILRLTTARWYTPVGRSIHKERSDQIASLERSVRTLSNSLASLPDTVAKPIYRTDSGREVLGGGGIIPDVLVMADTLTTRESEVIREVDRSGPLFQTAVFNFAVRYLQEDPELQPDFRIGPEDMERFRGLLGESGVPLSPAQFQRLGRFVRFQLEREIALQAWGEAGEFRRMMDSDRVLQRTLTLLRDSGTTSDLLRLAARPENSDWTPVVATEETQEEGSAPAGAGAPQGS
jgi:carboxyl-terminal processing protease